MDREPKAVPRNIVPALLLAAVLATGCTPQVRVVEVEVTAAPQTEIVEVTATPTPPPPMPVISVDNADELVPLRRFEVPNFQEVRETCGVAFSPDGKHLATACKSDTIPLWDVETGQLTHTFGGDGWVWASVAFSPDGKTLAAGGHRSAISLWDISTGERLGQIRGASGGISELAFSPDGQRLASSAFGGSAMLWDVETGDRLATFQEHRSRINTIDFSPDGEMVVSGGGDNKARVWDTSGQEIIVLEGPTFYVEDVEFDPGGLRVVGACDDSTIRLWDTGTGDLIHTLREHTGPVNGVTYSPDGRLLASASNDRTLRLWDAGSGEMLAQFRAHSDLAIRPAFSPDGTMIATVSWDGTVVLWGVSGNSQPPVSPTETIESPSSVIVVPQGDPATLDGILSPGEWDSARAEALTKGGELLLMHADGYLYLGIRARDMGYGSICIAQDDQVSVLHSSAALGTAVFERDGDDWRRTRQFSWCCRSTVDSPERQAHLQQEGWIASIGYMGTREEMEYQIAMDGGTLTLAAVYQEGPGLGSALWWPENLEDDCLGLVLLPDNPPERLDFSPETWVAIAASTTASDNMDLSAPTPTATPTSSADLGDIRTRSSDGMAMVYVPGGTFLMGSAEEEIEDAISLCRQHYSICNRWYYMRESPQHSVSLDGFWLDQTEITNAQYRQCVEEGICSKPLECKKGEPTYSDAEKSTHPVVCVDWNAANEYCEWAGARLPTEAEWEYAFRGEQGSIYPWGDFFDGAKLNYCDVNCDLTHADDKYDDGYSRTAPVGSYPEGASWCGALGMSGNVSEWVADWLSDYSPGAQSSPMGPSSGSEKIIRGGSWFSHPTYCRGAIRASISPDIRYDHVGFRCAVP